MSGKPKATSGLTPAQERRRKQGLRLLARIIARHRLEHPDRYPLVVDAAEVATAANKEDAV